MKNFFIETYGCQMNFAQSVQLNNKMKEYGYQQLEHYQDADIVIINACSVRKHAEDRVFNRINFFNALKRKKEFKLVVTGCFAQNVKDKIDADYVLGTYQIDKIPEIINNGFQKHHVNVDMDNYNFLTPVPEEYWSFRSLVDITKGCDNYCSYCIVPYVRGPQFSRKSKEIIEEIKKLVSQGVKEIILLGQNVNSYGLDNKEISFSELLSKINALDGVERIRFITSHPKDFNDEIIHAVFSNKKVCPAIHLPLQSGSNRILGLMNRKYTMERYYEIIDKIKAYNRNYSLSTDLLVGFPGETELDFLQTMEAVEKIKFTEAFTFKYSSRPHIQANNFQDPVPEEVKAERLEHIIKIQKNIEKKMITNNLHQIRNVLIEGKTKKDTGKYKGRDELNYIVVIDTPVKIGKFYQVKINDIHGITLIGQIIS